MSNHTEIRWVKYHPLWDEWKWGLFIVHFEGGQPHHAEPVTVIGYTLGLKPFEYPAINQQIANASTLPVLVCKHTVTFLDRFLFFITPDQEGERGR